MVDRATLPRPMNVASPMVDTLNRVICQWRENPTHAFLGLAPVGGDYTAWGIPISGNSYCAAHLFSQDFPWGDDDYDTVDTAKVRPWVIMFLGYEDRSWYRRFETEAEAIAHFERLDAVRFDDEGTFKYES